MGKSKLINLTINKEDSAQPWEISLCNLPLPNPWKKNEKGGGGLTNTKIQNF